MINSSNSGIGTVRFVLSLFLTAIFLSSTGCVTAPQKQGSSDIKKRPFHISHIAKGDIDMVAETNIRFTMKMLLELAIKLYKRNPMEWRKAGFQDPEQAAEAIFSSARHDMPTLQGKRSIDALRLTFDNGYNGDRVFAFIFGMRTMILTAYKDKQHFYILDDLDPQKIYNAARNFEVAAWKLGHDRDPHGQLYLVSNELSGPVINLSYERTFGKLIALHDSMAQIIADKSNRTIKNVIQGVAKMVFLPI